MEREYIVTLHKNQNTLEFLQEMVMDYGSDTIPSRSIEVANLRLVSKRNTHFMLTEEEAEIVRQDPRVEAVEIPPEQREDIGIGKRIVQVGDFDKPATGTYDATKVNWGLHRCIDHLYSYTGNTASSNEYTYNLDGTGVDIVIQDSGIEADHPEWEDRNGVSRLQQIDWYSGSSVVGSMPTDHYTDYEGHGTHCAGIAAGKTYGWAKNARIYALKVDGLDGPTDPHGGIPIADCFDLITDWHNRKTPDPQTGLVRPTIVNMSWGYNGFYTSLSNINYRGADNAVTEGSMEAWNLGLPPLGGPTYTTTTRISSVDADVEEMIAAGIHVCIAAGNKYHKIDVVGGDDYDNYADTLYNSSPIVRHYHRGASPLSENAFMVGNVDTVLDTATSTKETPKGSSERGPQVDIFAPGTYITSSTSNVNDYGSLPGAYPQDAGYKIVTISGTSMASPQVCGMGACVLGLYPAFTPADLKYFIIRHSQPTLHDTGLDDDYTDQDSLMGAENRMLYMPYHRGVPVLPSPTVIGGVLMTAPTWSGSPFMGNDTSIRFMYKEAIMSDIKGTHVRVTITNPSSSLTCTYNEMWIGKRNMAGAEGEFDGEQVPLTWNSGSTSVTIPALGTVTSDYVDISGWSVGEIDGAQDVDLIVSMYQATSRQWNNVVGGTGYRYMRWINGGNNASENLPVAAPTDDLEHTGIIDTIELRTTQGLWRMDSNLTAEAGTDGSVIAGQGAAYVAGKFSNGLKNGVGSYSSPAVRLPVTHPLSDWPNTSLTIEGWLWAEGGIAREVFLTNYDDNFGGGPYGPVFISIGSTIQARFFNDSEQSFVTGNASVGYSTWAHVAAVWNHITGFVSFYVDGTRILHHDASGESLKDLTQLSVAGTDKYVDDIRVSSAALYDQPTLTVPTAPFDVQ
jgi:subtilisin family serine protease